MANTTRTKEHSKEKDGEFKKLLGETTLTAIPQPGDVVTGTILSVGKTEVYIDIKGYKTGVVRGRELYSEATELSRLKPGEEIEATVIDLENENGDVELSLRFAGHRRAWDNVLALKSSGAPLTVTVVEANKGGLMARVGHLLGFLPVSQLSPEHYPRVSGGEKQKILEKLKTFVGQEMQVRVLDASENEEKLILSEKSLWEEEQKNVLSRFQLGDTVEGEITAVTDFGAFLKFDSLEGLVHISEIAWQRIDHPRDLLKVGDHARAKIIGIQGSKIFLSIKQLIDDPWKNIAERYQLGAVVRGKILKANPFGFFVELDPEIHGLAHISELAPTPIKDPLEVAKVGDVLDWKIISLEPENHRLGLSLKALQEKNSPEPSAEKLTDKKEEPTPPAPPNESNAAEQSAQNSEPPATPTPKSNATE